MTAPAELLPFPLVAAPDFRQNEGSLGSAQAGPNPYLDFSRRFTPEGGIELTFKAKDDRAWVWWLRFVLWLGGVSGTYLILMSQSVALSPITAGFLTLGLSLLASKLLFADDGHACTIEVRPDSFVVDGADVFWRESMELGPPQLEERPRGTFRLVGTYGTRAMEYCRLHAFDENDRQPQVFFAHVQFAMEQLWRTPT